jgi:hypothetical protein
VSDDSASGSLTERIAAGVPHRGIRLAYGDVQSVDGAAVLPVAIVTYGFGASDASARWGVGGGGGGVAVPLGAYVAGERGPRFRANPVVVLALLVPLVGVVGGLLLRLARR